MNTFNEESFRDHINTTDAQGRRSWVYAAAPSGKLHTYRFITAMGLLALFFLMPFLKIRGNPFLLLDVLDRRFIILGKIFWPQDFHFFVIGLITLIIGIVLFTVVYGRVWCGWTCPQTVFLEMVFRKIEFLIEGSPQKQRRLDEAEMSFDKIRRKGLKHLVYILISLLVIHTLASYILGTGELLGIMRSGPAQHMGLFFILLVFSGIFYFVFARFREQVCTLVCPYGRLQGVMLDANSLVVAYDFRRGEERGKWKKGEDRPGKGKGDCIDCGNCVRVCPTGIDIRNGTQLECINCTACIDACNGVMRKIGYRPGLVRIASYNEIAQGRKARFTPRIIAYTVLLIGLLITMITLFISRNDTETTILRVPGSLYQDMGESWSNIYNLQIVNKSDTDLPVYVTTESIKGRVQVIGDTLLAKSQETTEGVFLLYLDKTLVNSSKIPVTFGIWSEGKLIEKEKATFVGP